MEEHAAIVQGVFGDLYAVFAQKIAPVGFRLRPVYFQDPPVVIHRHVIIAAVAGVSGQEVQILLLGKLVWQDENSLAGRAGADLRPLRHFDAAAALAASVGTHDSPPSLSAG